MRKRKRKKREREEQRRTVNRRDIDAVTKKTKREIEKKSIIYKRSNKLVYRPGGDEDYHFAKSLFSFC